ncbi:MAG: GGDEF domain-containing protein [Oscillospiraceae bacterium]|nr:GGDEF domain-containing protein [Oscillospiraceae bacterium]
MKIIKRMTQEDISKLNTFIPFPMVIYNHERILFHNALFEELAISDAYMMDYAQNYTLKELGRAELDITSENENALSFVLSNQQVVIDDVECFLTFLIDNTENKAQGTKLIKMCELRDRMLDINTSIITMSDLNEALNFILENALKAIEKASMGTVFILENNNFKVASYVGFTKELEEFLLPFKDAFLYVATDGKMDRIVSTGNFQDFERCYPIKTDLGDDFVIHSTISSPIYIKEAFMGMINIDSTIKNAFDEDDIKAMEFVRNNIELAITNHLTYSHNASQSKHDSLTHLYNRYFFAEQFELAKENAISNKEKFFVVMIDIDGLKNINDEYGHLAGDKVIVRISSEIFRNSSNHDIVARFGGDEFVGIFLNTKIEALELLLDTIKLGMTESPVFYESSKITPSFSYGIASFPDDGCELSELIKIADERMYTKKRKDAELKFNRYCGV